MALMNSLMCKHGLAYKITDCENVRLIRPHLRINWDKATFVYDHTRLIRADRCTIWPAANRLQHQIIDLRLFWCAFSFELNMNTIGLRLCTHCLTFQHHSIKTMGIKFLPDLYEITISTLHQTIEHFDDINAGTQRGVDRRHLKTDDAATDDEHSLGAKLQLQRTR